VNPYLCSPYMPSCVYRSNFTIKPFIRSLKLQKLCESCGSDEGKYEDDSVVKSGAT
jgi:hypothetical protein